jgi:hypothetical protein
MNIMSRFICRPALILIALLGAVSAAGQDTLDPILQYYWDHARSASRGSNPDQAGIGYSFRAKTYLRAVNEDGVIRKTDSVVQDYFFDHGVLDSVTTVAGDPGKFKKLDLTWPAIFDSTYHLSFFPNDIGAPRLALRIWSDSTQGSQPDGLVVIDRNDYHPCALYLYYPDKGGYRRFTRSFRFTVADGYVFPDSVWEVATRLGVFFAESYRLETGISNIRVWRTAPETERRVEPDLK